MYTVFSITCYLFRAIEKIDEITENKRKTTQIFYR